MKKLSALLLLLLPCIIWGHQDVSYQFEYGNVKVRFTTGRRFEEIQISKIIGEYAALLSDSLDYHQPIFLDFIHDYVEFQSGKTLSYMYQGSQDYQITSFYKLEYDSLFGDESMVGVSYDDSLNFTDEIEREVYNVPGIDEAKAIVIRQFGNKFSLSQTLELLKFAIQNPEKIEEHSTTYKQASYLEYMFYQLKSIPVDFIDSIQKLESPLVKHVLKKRVYKEHEVLNSYETFFSYYSENGKYVVFAEIHNQQFPIDSLDHIYYFPLKAEISNRLFVFESPGQMRFYTFSPDFNNLVTRSKKHRFSTQESTLPAFFRIDDLGGDIYQISIYSAFGYRPDNRLLYLSDEDILIKDFDAFLNSYQSKEKF